MGVGQGGISSRKCALAAVGRALPRRLVRSAPEPSRAPRLLPHPGQLRRRGGRGRPARGGRSRRRTLPERWLRTPLPPAPRRKAPPGPPQVSGRAPPTAAPHPPVALPWGPRGRPPHVGAAGLVGRYELSRGSGCEAGAGGRRGVLPLGGGEGGREEGSGVPRERRAAGTGKPRPGAAGLSAACPGCVGRRAARPPRPARLPTMLDGLKMEESLQSALDPAAPFSSLLGKSGLPACPPAGTPPQGGVRPGGPRARGPGAASPLLVPARSPARRRAAPFARGVPPAPAFPAPVSFRDCVKLCVPPGATKAFPSYRTRNNTFFFLRFNIGFKQSPSLRAAALPPPFQEERNWGRCHPPGGPLRHRSPPAPGAAPRTPPRSAPARQPARGKRERRGPPSSPRPLRLPSTQPCPRVLPRRQSRDPQVGVRRVPASYFGPVPAAPERQPVA